jgi:hypothetical protein
MLAYYAVPRWYEFGERRWNDILTGENRRTRRKTCLSATLSTTIPTWAWTRASMVSGRWLNDLSHGTAWSGMLLLADHSCCSYPPFCSFVCKMYTPILSCCPIACTDNGFIFRRLDYFILSQKLIPNLCDNIIRSQVYGSDHCPITLLINIWSVPF